MSIYLIIKFIHTTSIILWLGGVTILILKAARAIRASNAVDFGMVLADTAFFNKWLFMPAALATLICGLIMVFMAWAFSYLWLWLGLIGLAASVASGSLVMKPRALAAVKLMQNPREMLAKAKQVLCIASFNVVLLFVVVADMVFKPALSDAVTVAVMAIVVIGAGVLLLPRVVR